MTLANRIKEELMNADIDYQFVLSQFKADYPHGISFLGETVSAKAATSYATLERYTERYNALAALVNPKLENSAMQRQTERIINKYNNAETSEETEAARKEYFDLYTIRSA